MELVNQVQRSGEHLFLEFRTKLYHHSFCFTES